MIPFSSTLPILLVLPQPFLLLLPMMGAMANFQLFSILQIFSDVPLYATMNCSSSCPPSNDAIKLAIPQLVYDNGSKRIFALIPPAPQIRSFCPCLACSLGKEFDGMKSILPPTMDANYERQLANNVSIYIGNVVEECADSDEMDPQMAEFLRQIRAAVPFGSHEKMQCNEVGLCEFWKFMAISSTFAFLLATTINIALVFFKKNKCVKEGEVD